MTEEQTPETDVPTDTKISCAPADAEGTAPEKHNAVVADDDSDNSGNDEREQIVPKRHKFTSSIVVLLIMIASGITLLVFELTQYMQSYMDNADTSAGFDLFQFSKYQLIDLTAISLFLLLLIAAGTIIVIGTLRSSKKLPSPAWRVLMSLFMLFPMGYVVNMVFKKCACLAPSEYHVPLGMPEFMRFGETVLGIAVIVALVFIVLIIIVFRDAMRCANINKKKYDRATLVAMLVLLAIGAAMIAFCADSNLSCIYELLQVAHNTNTAVHLMIIPTTPQEMDFPIFLHELVNDFIQMVTAPIDNAVLHYTLHHTAPAPASNLASNLS